MRTNPVTDSSHQALVAREHVCFGISPFNSYFSESCIFELAKWGRSEFKSMHFFVPDIPASYTLEALGYEPKKAAWKARRQSQYLLNKIGKCLDQLGYSLIAIDEMILHWEKLQSNPRYRSLHQQTIEHFQQEPEFQSACLEASRWALEKRVNPTQELTLETLRSATRYLLSEIPLFIDSAGITQQQASVFCYPQCIPFIESLMKGDFGVPVSPHQGFVVIEPLSNVIPLSERRPSELRDS